MRPRRPNGLVVAVDGPAGAGKSTVARGLARRLGYVYLDTGAMYRVVGLLAREAGVDPEDDTGLTGLAEGAEIAFEPAADGRQRVRLGARDVTDEIRTAEASQWASKVSARPGVRQSLVRRQRELGRDGGVVAEGRDVGTVVFPDADVKFFLEASAAERGRRRFLELRARGESADLDQTIAEIEERDRRDRGREHSPLRPADDAIFLDTTSADADAVLEILVDHCRRAGESA